MHRVCHHCLYNENHPFGLILNGNECSGCMTHREKNSLSWLGRKDQLVEMLKKYKKYSRKYDCIVPVVGDAEDFYTVSKVLELGLCPLVVSVNDYFKNDIGWHNLHQLITYFDVDSFVFNPDLRVYKELVKTSLRKFNHILLPFLQLHTSFPIHVAFNRRIPLIIWGQSQVVEQVGKFSHTDSVQMSRWNRKQHDLFEVEVDELVGNGAQVDTRSLNYYQYPPIHKLEGRGITGLYLSNYFRWDPLPQNKSVIEFGFHPESNSSSFDIYERAGSSVYYKFHDLLKFKRVGYRKIRDHLVRELRHGRINRAEAVSIESFYTEQTVNIKPFFDWLDTTKSGFEWFKMHRLSEVKHLISEEKVEVKNIILPAKLQDLIHISHASEEEFLFFDKGIDI